MLNFIRSGTGRLALATALTAATLGAASFGTATAATAVSVHATAKSAVVVKERARAHFGKILVTPGGRALYYLPHGSCTGQCLAIWPRLVMPAGATEPKGASCLGTSAFGSAHRLQVTYRKHRLYTFVSDSGTSVNGNGVAGFKVARVVTGRCR